MVIKVSDNEELEKNQEIKQTDKKQKSGFLLGMIAGMLVAMLVTTVANVIVKTVLASHQTAQQASASDEAPTTVVNDETMKKLEAIEDIINKYYYKEEDISVENMIEGMYAGAVSSLKDPYSTYYTAEEWKEMMQDTAGVYYGIGAYVSLDKLTGYAKISGVIDDTPAQEAQLREEDILYKINDETTAGLELSEVVARIKGEEGTTVHLTIYREGEADYLELDVERRQIETPTVKHEMYDNGVAYIQIVEFDEVTATQFKTSLDEVTEMGAKGLILDLRSNPGGSLPVVVDIARSILPEGMIVYTEDKNGKREEYTCDGEHELQIPLVVLVNGNSASASEILAGAIKDYKKGTLIGTTTFGKGIVQRVLPMTDGTAMKLTISSYYTPNGNNIHGVGIEPDIVCEFDSKAYYDDGVDNQLERAREEIEKQIAD